MSRPELMGVGPSSYYDKTESKKYHESSRVTHIQAELTDRAIELLGLPQDKPSYILDIGCGSGLSGRALEENGHYWAGCDISPSMLGLVNAAMIDDDSGEDDESAAEGEVNGEKSAAVGGAKRQAHNDEEYSDSEEDENDDDDEEDEEGGSRKRTKKKETIAQKLPSLAPGTGGDVLCADMGQGLPFAPGTFDGAISISALQWLCYSNSSEEDPKLRINRFFSSLYSVLKKSAKAVLQFYPENADQALLLAQAASKVGFSGGVLVDYPNSSKAKKYFLCLSFESTYHMPTALGTGAPQHGHQTGSTMVGGVETRVKTGHQQRRGRKSKVLQGQDKLDWIQRKKEKHRRQGKDVKGDSKFTGRKRARGF